MNRHTEEVRAAWDAWFAGRKPNILRRTRIHTALAAMHGVARHFYDGFNVGLKVEAPAPPVVRRGRK